MVSLLSVYEALHPLHVTTVCPSDIFLSVILLTKPSILAPSFVNPLFP